MHTVGFKKKLFSVYLFRTIMVRITTGKPLQNIGVSQRILIENLPAMKNSVSQQTYHAAPGFAVSLICINKSDWIYADYNETKEQAFDKMQKNRFDVLPVREADGTFKKYFKAKEWGNFGVNDIKMFEIKPKDCIDHGTSIRDAVKAFAKRNRNFYFLKNGKEVTGLLTAGNLNSKHVYIYL